MGFYDDLRERLFKRETPRSEFKSLFQRLDVENFFNNLTYLVDPNDLVRKAGGRHKLEKLYQSDEIYQAVRTRISALLNTKLIIDHPDESIKNFFEEQILPFERQLKEDFWWAVPYGYSVVQIDYRKDGTVNNFQREQFWRFEPMADLIHVKLVNSQLVNYNNKILPYGKWVLTTNGGTTYMPQGEAMFSRLLQPWLFRCNDWDLWMTFAKRFAGGFLVGKTPNEDQVNEMRKELEKAAKAAVISLTDDSTVDLLQPNRDSSLFAEIDDRTIRSFQKVILGQTQTSDMQSRGGSGSAAVHNEVRWDITLSDVGLVKKSFEETINQIAYVNSLDLDEMPTVKLLIDEGLNNDLADRDTKLFAMGTRFTKKYLINNYGFEEDDIDVVDIQSPLSSVFELKKKDFLTLSDKQEFWGLEDCPDCGGHFSDNINFESRLRDESRQLNEKEETVDYLKRWGREPIDIDDLTSAILSSNSEKQLDQNLLALFDQDSPELIDTLTETFYYAASKGALLGNPKNIEPQDDFAVKKNDVTFAASVARLKNRVAVTRYYFEDMPKEIRSLAFYVSDLEKLREIEMVKRSLSNAIDQGESFRTWRDNLDIEGISELSNARLEVVYRNNVNTVYNQSARYNAGTSGVTPYLMYTAVADSRTRPSHLELDGTIKPADSSFWDTYTGPIAHNCRCGVIALTESQAEDMGGVSKQRNFKTKPAVGFGKSGYGDVLGGSKDAAEKAINSLPKKSPYRSRFKSKIASISNLVDIWYRKNQNVFID